MNEADVELKDTITQLKNIQSDIHSAWQGRAGLVEDLQALTLAIGVLQAKQEGKLVEAMSADEIFEIISLSSASQIFIANHSAEETQRAIDDMHELASQLSGKVGE